MFRRHPLSLLISTLMLFAGSTVMAADTGDAPASYGTASHEVVSGGPFLGTVPADDNSPVATSTADGDDLANGDDEDGVSSFLPLYQNIKAYTLTVLANNPGATDANLIAWIDFDGNGSFDPDESASAVVTSSSNTNVELQWSELRDIATDFLGTSYVRVRISTDALGSTLAGGTASNGEVEDYAVEILADSDGDEIPDQDDLDDDNDGIPDTVEVIGIDTDNDGIENYLDSDSDNDGISDLVEAGPSPDMPVDTDGDGIPDYLDLDSNNDGTLDADPIPGDDDGDGLVASVEGAGDTDGDGILNTQDLDSDNDTIPDAVEAVDTTNPIDTDADGIPDFRDLDSDNDGIPDLYEASVSGFDTTLLDTDVDGRVDNGSVFGANGLVDIVETAADSGILIYQLVDTDSDGARDYVDTDSDNDGVSDTIESGGQDADGNGVVDSDIDANSDGLVDGNNAVANAGTLLDDDNDGIPNFQDDDSVGGTTGGSTDPDIARIETGLSGYPGCSIIGSRTIGFDPVLLFLVVTAFGVLMFRRRKSAKRSFIRV